MAPKRKNDATAEDDDRGKKLRLSEDEDRPSTKEIQPAPQKPVATEAAPPHSQNDTSKGNEVETQGGPSNNEASTSSTSGSKQKKRIRKLTPARPWPIVPTSVSATGPRSAHKEGKNLICISRKTGLATYMRRCKEVIIKDGYKTLHLSAMGAAIPLLLQLTCALPPILPFSTDDIKTEVTTQTCEVRDEVLPEDDDEDITMQHRSKSTLLVVITIGDGKFEGDTSGPLRKTGKKNVNNKSAKSRSEDGRGKGKGKGPIKLVYTEPDQDELMDMV